MLSLYTIRLYIPFCLPNKREQFLTSQPSRSNYAPQVLVSMIFSNVSHTFTRSWSHIWHNVMVLVYKNKQRHTGTLHNTRQHMCKQNIAHDATIVLRQRRRSAQKPKQGCQLPNWWNGCPYVHYWKFVVIYLFNRYIPVLNIVFIARRRREEKHSFLKRRDNSFAAATKVSLSKSKRSA